MPLATREAHHTNTGRPGHINYQAPQAPSSLRHPTSPVRPAITRRQLRPDPTARMDPTTSARSHPTPPSPPTSTAPLRHQLTSITPSPAQASHPTGTHRTDRRPMDPPHTLLPRHVMPTDSDSLDPTTYHGTNLTRRPWDPSATIASLSLSASASPRTPSARSYQRIDPTCYQGCRGQVLPYQPKGPTQHDQGEDDHVPIALVTMMPRTGVME